MGSVVTFAELPETKAADGIVWATIPADTKEMAAELVRVAPGKRWTATAPRGSDCYLFMRSGAGTISAAGDRHRFPAQAFATVQEGVEFTVENDGGAPVEAIKVIAPPQPNGRSLTGFTGGLSVIERGKAPVLEIPKDRKTRLYFVDDAAAKSERGHAMIVVYEKETVTGMHMHPNAESMFVVLDGALQFTVNGEQVVVKPGQAAIFGTNDRHGLHTADGLPGASFLEFHIPAAYTTVKG
jgi:mannose-6-phosphate isomerase-like protein (cupin superfamily)